jgi:hypothetical protein
MKLRACINGEDINAVFVTDKCQTNKKLLCIWHMLNNVSDYCAGKFKNVAVKDE